jgi:hypothetical protein
MESYQGQKNNKAKLTEAQVIEMRNLYHLDGVQTKILAAKYKIDKTQIQRIVNGKHWPHLPMPIVTGHETYGQKLVRMFDKVLDAIDVNEELVWVPSFENEYAITNKGKVFSFINYRMGKQLKIFDVQGYLKVSLINHKSGSRRYFLHRLLAKAFLPNPNNYPCVNHKNGIKTDNSLTNLEWCTVKHNNAHAIATGLHPGVQGEANITSKLTEQQVIEIRDLYHKQSMKQRDIAKLYNMSQTAIKDITKGKIWKHVPMPDILRDFHNSKLTDTAVIDIRERFHKNNYSIFSLSKIYGVAENTIEAVVYGDTWKHIPMPSTLRKKQ